MRKLSTLLLATVLLSSTAFAQDEPFSIGKFTIGVATGEKFIENRMGRSTKQYSELSSGLPLYGIVDYRITDKITIGGRAGYVKGFAKLPKSGGLSDEVEVTRFSLSLRGTYDLYVSPSNSVFVYSGLRIGMKGYVTEYSNRGEKNQNANRRKTDKLDDRMLFNLTVLGAKTYFTNSLGMIAEVNVGTPNILTVGVIFTP